MRTAKIRFENKTAQEAHEFTIGFDGIDLVMAWYGAYWAGDEYQVTVDGQLVAADQNGERDHGEIEGADVLH